MFPRELEFTDSNVAGCGNNDVHVDIMPAQSKHSERKARNLLAHLQAFALACHVAEDRRAGLIRLLEDSFAVVDVPLERRLFVSAGPLPAERAACRAARQQLRALVGLDLPPAQP